jgi:hypothetical protein
MVYAPGHFQRSTEQAKARRRFRSRRERIAVQAMAIITVALVAVTVFSLTNHQRTSGHGCVDFNYSTVIGGAETYECGARARSLCATPPAGRSYNTSFQIELYKACRKAGIRTGRA